MHPFSGVPNHTTPFHTWPLAKPYITLKSVAHLQKPPTVDLASSEPQLRLVKICHQFCIEFDAFKELNILLIVALATFLSAEDIIMEPSCFLTTCDYNGEI